MDPQTKRDRYDEANDALYESIRFLKLKEDEAAERRADSLKKKLAKKAIGR